MSVFIINGQQCSRVKVIPITFSHSTIDQTIQVTKEGYQSLESSALSETVEVFPEPRSLPKDMTRDMFHQLRHHFKYFISV
jgi:hypothetical protein